MAAPFSTLAEAARWFSAWLAEAALPLWAQAGVDPKHGLFQEALTAHGAPADLPRRARAQARQVFVFATVANAGFGAGWLDVARRGYIRFAEVYRRPDGLFLRRAAGDGTALEQEADIYDQAFVMLALEALHAADPGAGHAEQAMQVLGALQARRGPVAGFLESPPHVFQANCHMHLLETALAWEETGGGAAWTGLADEIVGMALTRFIDPVSGAVREFFDADWRALRGEPGLVEPGHQFEWAWLLERWGRARDDRAALGAAKRLHENGLKGVDTRRNVAVNAVWEDFAIREADARLWPQTEWLKAALVLGTEAEALRAAQGLAQYLETPVRGVWRDKLRADGTFVEEPAPATSLYHLLVAILELRARAGG
jgi:mannose-6-phosphate isomerase